MCTHIGVRRVAQWTLAQCPNDKVDTCPVAKKIMKNSSVELFNRLFRKSFFCPVSNNINLFVWNKLHLLVSLIYHWSTLIRLTPIKLLLLYLIVICVIYYIWMASFVYEYEVGMFVCWNKSLNDNVFPCIIIIIFYYWKTFIKLEKKWHWASVHFFIWVLAHWRY